MGPGFLGSAPDTNPIRGAFFGCCASVRRAEARAKPTSKTTIAFVVIPPCLQRFIAGCPERFSLPSTQDAVDVSIEWRRMSRHTLFKGLFCSLEGDLQIGSGVREDGQG